MRNATKIQLVVFAAVATIAASVWGVSQAERSAAATAFDQNSLADEMEIRMLELETNLRGFAQTARPEFTQAYEQAEGELALATARLDASGLAPELAGSLARMRDWAERWQLSAERALDAVKQSGPAILPVRNVLRRTALMARFRDEADRFDSLLSAQRSERASVMGYIVVGVIVLLSLLFGGIGYTAISRNARAAARRRDAEAEYRRTQGEFSAALQVTRDEPEANKLLKRHIERSVPGSDVVVLNRNNSDNRLEPATEIDEAGKLAQAVEGAKPADCLALRLGRMHEGDESLDELLQCELCGKRPGRTTCVPSLVGGEVVGTLLLHHVDPLEESERQRVVDSVAQAAPVLANLRNLAIAEMRASTDALTGLPNNRSVQETFRRLVANAGRTVTPLAAILLDLDHFKQINDSEGHDKGDDVLAAVGAVLGTHIRGSDFAGRYGGEEFLILLPDTDADGGRVVADKLRLAISELALPGLRSRVTGSFGVAALPTHAGDVDDLLRAADRALYRAKSAGRNRVEIFASDELTTPIAG